MAFNEFATPTVATERLKLYLDIGTSSTSPLWELEGRGVKTILSTQALMYQMILMYSELLMLL